MLFRKKKENKNRVKNEDIIRFQARALKLSDALKTIPSGHINISSFYLQFTNAIKLVQIVSACCMNVSL